MSTDLAETAGAPDPIGGPAADRQWWRSGVVYQVYLRSFQDSDGDGIGDLRGLIARLDHLERLGVDAVWLSPVFPSPQADNGYDVSDYRDVDPVLGSLADLDELVAGLHRRGIRLVMDMVVNHTSAQHPWFVESRSGAGSPKRDWYFWRPPRPGTTAGEPGAEPNNWGSYFSGPAWTFDEASGEYYLHLFSDQQPDLDWSNAEVRAAVQDMMRWWLGRGVDGFRLDVVNFLSKAEGLPDAGDPDVRDADGGRWFSYGPRIHEYLHELRTEVFRDHPDAAFLIGEMPDSTVEQAARYTDPARREVDMVVQFEHVELDHGVDPFHRVDLPVPTLRASLERWQTGLAAGGWNSLYLSNHDQSRAVSRFGDPGVHRERSAKTLALMLHLLRGTPFVYQGEELAMVDAGFGDIRDYRDVQSLNYHRAALAAGTSEEDALALLRAGSRDSGRTPIPWDSTAHHGFTSGTPWIPLPEDAGGVTVEQAEADPGSVLHLYRRLIALRHADPVVAVGTIEFLARDSAQLVAYRRALGGRELIVVSNLSGEPADLTGVDLTGASLMLSTLRAPAAAPDPGRLEPWEGRLYERTVPAGAVPSRTSAARSPSSTPPDSAR